MTAPALETTGLGKRYGRRWALRDCTLSVPTGRVTALVGPNGAGKTTLLHLAVGLLRPTTGQVRVTGRPFSRSTDDLARVAFVAQEKPLPRSFTVAETLRFGQAMNPRFDTALARNRLTAYQLDPRQKVSRLSGGQRTLLALALALAKRAELLLLDEPLSDLDPLARHEVMAALMAAASEDASTVVLSSHVLTDLAETCDHLVLLSGGRLQMSGDFQELTDGHRVVTGSAQLADRLVDDPRVVELRRTDRQTTALIRGPGVRTDPTTTVREATLEELVLAYMRNPNATALPAPAPAPSGRVGTA